MVTALQHGTWMDEEGFKKAVIKEKKKRGVIHQPLYSTWVAEFMLRQDAGRVMLGKYLSDKKIPWQKNPIELVDKAQDIEVTIPVK